MIVLGLAAVALVGCGGAVESEEKKRAIEARTRALAMGFDGAEARIFAQDSRYCSMQPRADLAREFGLPGDATPRAIARWHAEGARPRDRKVVFAGCLDGLSRTPARAPPSSPLAQALWGREFVAISASGLPRRPDPPVRRPPHIRIGFSSEQNQLVGWGVGCNAIGGKVRITSTKLLVRSSGTTLIGCVGEVEEEEEWLSRFMASEPEWHLEGTELTLVARGAKIELEGFEDPDSCPVSASGGRIDFTGATIDCESAILLLTVYAEGRQDLRGWKCHGEELSDGLDRVVCRGRKVEFTARDFDLDSLRRGAP